MNRLSYSLYQLKQSKNVLFTNDRDYPMCFVNILGQDKYHYIKLHSFNKYISELQKLDVDALIDIYDDYKDQWMLRLIWFNRDDFAYDMLTNPKQSLKQLSQLKKQIGKYIFHVFTYKNKTLHYIHQKLQYGIQEQGNFNALQLYNKLKQIFQMDTATFEHYFGKITYSEDSNLKNVQYHNWNIVFDTNKQNIEFIHNLLDNVENKLGKLKDKLCYGTVNIMSKLQKSTNLAQYMPTVDSINLKTNNKVNEDYIRTFLHELGHRLMDLYLTEQQKAQIEKLYQNNKNDKYYIPNINDKITLTSNTQFQVIKVEAKNQVEGKLIQLSDNLKKKGFTKNQRIIFFGIVKIDIDSINGIKFDSNSYFPTRYSYTNVDQFFCELFSYYLTDSLKNKNALNWIKKFLKNI